MGKTRFTCEYCNKSFEDSQEARLRHSRGRNHKANVKLWFDSFADQEQHAAAAASASGADAARTGYNLMHQTLPPWESVDPNFGGTAPGGNQPRDSPLLLQNLPPSMLPAPPGAFYHCRSDWG